MQIQAQAGSLSIGIGLLVMVALLGVTTLKLTFEKELSQGDVLPGKVEDSVKDVQIDEDPSEVKLEVEESNPDVIEKDDGKDEDTSEDSISLLDFLYPGASIVDETEDSVRLNSSDTPEEITQWFEEAIKGKEMKTKSFVKTNTNGEVENVLVGVLKGMEIRVIITKVQEAQTTGIEIRTSKLD